MKVTQPRSCASRLGMGLRDGFRGGVPPVFPPLNRGQSNFPRLRCVIWGWGGRGQGGAAGAGRGGSFRRAARPQMVLVKGLLTGGSGPAAPSPSRRAGLGPVRGGGSSRPGAPVPGGAPGAPSDPRSRSAAPLGEGRSLFPGVSQSRRAGGRPGPAALVPLSARTPPARSLLRAFLETRFVSWRRQL